VVVLAVCVFVLALRAKLSLYDPPQVGSVNPASVSKLWVSSDKVKPATAVFLPVLWFAALLSLLPPARSILTSQAGHTPAPRHLTLRELYRFLRPPPTF
jgi:hypothetical protein